MWENSFVVQLLLFGVAQCAAWTNLLRGRFWLGFAQFALLCILADALLIARLVYADAEPWSTRLLWSFQAVAVITIAELGYRLVRHRSRRARAQRDRTYEQAFADWLGGRTEAAERGLRRLARDPWDFESALLLATVLGDRGDRKGARRWLHRARRRTQDPRRHDEIAEELRRLARALSSSDSPGPDAPTRRKRGDAREDREDRGVQAQVQVRDARRKRAG